MASRVLLPVDASHNSKIAEDYIINLSKEMPLTVLLLHVVDTKQLDGHGLDPGLKETVISKKRAAAEKTLGDVAAKFKAADVEFERMILSGDPGPMICYTAQTEKIDQIIIAENDRSDLQDWFTGSVTNYVLTRSTVPVLLVKQNRTATDV
jgi:nucleotide-binding universal stress UspA family protein